jgi:hypothetical protein
VWFSPRPAFRSACTPPYRTNALRGVTQVVETDDPGGARVQSEYELLGASYAEAFDTVSRCASPASPSPAAAQTVPTSPHPPAQPQPYRRSRARRAYTVDVDQWDYWFLPPPPPSRTTWTRLVPPSVLTGHVSYLLPY